MGFQRIILHDPIEPKDVQLIQDNISNALAPIQKMPMVGGVLLSGLSLTSGQDNVFTHNLGHIPTLFLFGNLNTNSVVWSSGATTSQITLQCSVSCSIALWIN